MQWKIEKKKNWLFDFKITADISIQLFITNLLSPTRQIILQFTEFLTKLNVTNEKKSFLTETFILEFPNVLLMYFLISRVARRWKSGNTQRKRHSSRKAIMSFNGSTKRVSVVVYLSANVDRWRFRARDICCSILSNNKPLILWQFYSNTPTAKSSRTKSIVSIQLFLQIDKLCQTEFYIRSGHYNVRWYKRYSGSE